ncbi:TlpA family protein disulfide reductase [Mucilaginibacter ginsenosidivorax]|uniref:TlpA family protein disulfide reductase n=1 Tax=Mucilaginibacter ginsenosidivorax TaxID=862126 RepID=A0A5B8W9C9_9SPHI|nr:TlpA disulfide reductase family protein [Mucilaginibacter ginsenosidivorax]QEC78858.1 TlpA family protein disulfide reductase [Mucilaginibacter ginsenosidivorax]
MKNILLTTLLVVGAAMRIYASDYAVISGSVSQIEKGDSVIVLVSKYGYSFSEPLFEFKVYKAPILNHRFNIKISVGNIPLYTEIRFGSKHKVKPLIGYLIEKGDNITVNSTPDGFYFTGKGSEKLNVIYDIDRIEKSDLKGIGEDLVHPEGLNNIFMKIDISASHQLQLLETRKPDISNEAFVLIKAQILFKLYGEGVSRYYQNFSRDSLSQIALKTVINYPKPEIVNPSSVYLFNKNELLQYSATYATALILKYQFDSCYVRHRPFLINPCYKFIKNNYSGRLRERLITNLLYYYRGDDQDLSKPLNDALTFIRNNDFVKLLFKIKSSRLIGTQAYNFKLIDTIGKMHRLSDYKGKVVLMDFWYTGCGNCIQIAPYLEELEKTYANRPVIFLSINIDRTRNQWIKSINGGKYNSHYVTNLFTNGKELKHPICLHYNINACPTLILIDKSGALMQNPTDPRIDNGYNLKKQILDSI